MKILILLALVGVAFANWHYSYESKYGEAKVEAKSGAKYWLTKVGTYDKSAEIMHEYRLAQKKIAIKVKLVAIIFIDKHNSSYYGSNEEAYYQNYNYEKSYSHMIPIMAYHERSPMKKSDGYISWESKPSYGVQVYGARSSRYPDELNSKVYIYGKKPKAKIVVVKIIVEILKYGSMDLSTKYNGERLDCYLKGMGELKGLFLELKSLGIKIIKKKISPTKFIIIIIFKESYGQDYYRHSLFAKIKSMRESEYEYSGSESSYYPKPESYESESYGESYESGYESGYGSEYGSGGSYQSGSSASYPYPSGSYPYHSASASYGGSYNSGSSASYPYPSASSGYGSGAAGYNSGSSGSYPYPSASASYGGSYSSGSSGYESKYESGSGYDADYGYGYESESEDEYEYYGSAYKGAAKAGY